jgi:hypothetical protein
VPNPNITIRNFFIVRQALPSASGYRLLPSSGARVEAAYRFRSCAVVGNAGALRYMRLGVTIDMHDVVLRLNQAPTAAYTPWVSASSTGVVCRAARLPCRLFSCNESLMQVNSRTRVPPVGVIHSTTQAQPQLMLLDPPCRWAPKPPSACSTGSGPRTTRTAASSA